MKLAVVGATGRTGGLIVTQALNAGHQVKILARNPEKLGTLRSQVTAVQGNVTDPFAVDRLVEGSDVVLSSLGHARDSPRDVLSVAADHIIAAMRRFGVRRLVVLASVAVRDSEDHPTSFQRLLDRVVERAMGTLALDDAAAGRTITSSELDWTIVRAVFLTNGPRTARIKVGHFSRGAGTRISRADAADFMLACAVEGQHVRSCPLISH